ncbi:MAG: flavodoxin family protein [Candidatus Muiribacterium halophilum]|uniref:Flavodoxin family protein n=1 Tax=Muiribacterium halophilum TaxID=2053465 RepID=A0A2N5ZGF8_MUIH1|nr:MAG: flavodoxin family protein [Candidatus Muirbacterium halophilum]
MKVLAIIGSPRKDGNTTILTNEVINILKKENIETEILNIGGKTISPCIACGKCFDMQNKQCIQTEDIVNECILKMENSDAILIASPTYFANVSTEVKALIDRAGMVAKANGDMLKRKIGAAIVAERRGGAIQVFNAINAFFLINQMIVSGSSYWNLGIGMAKGDVKNDEEGLSTMRTLAQNILWLLKKIK